jgi:hypothetical protein
VRRLDNDTKCGEHGCRILTKLRHARLLIRTVKRQCGEPTDVSVNGALSLTERRAVSDRRRAAVHRGVCLDDRREHALNPSQHLLRVNDPFVGGLRSLDGAMDNPYHGQERDDGQSSRSAKRA